jgi:hypothetical protein
MTYEGPDYTQSSLEIPSRTHRRAAAPHCWSNARRESLVIDEGLCRAGKRARPVDRDQRRE